MEGSPAGCGGQIDEQINLTSIRIAGCGGQIDEQINLTSAVLAGRVNLRQAG